MSGIVAVASGNGRPIDLALLGAMVGDLAFRGPDGQGTWTDGAVALGHAWLDVGLDEAPQRANALSSGRMNGLHRPMVGRMVGTSPQPLSLDGEVWITADARIDGQAELRAELAGRGQAVAAEASDAALILHAYTAWGVDCVRHLIGDFAFVLWDRRARRLLAARDQFGIKPLFYASAEGQLILSNTLNAVRQHPAVSAALDELSIADLVLFEYNLDVERTAFAEIRRLPPAHVLEWEAGRVAIRRYWQIPQEPAIERRWPDDRVDELLFHFDRAVADRLRMPRVAVFMSGGLDSPAIAATAARHLAPEPPHEALRAVTVVYDRLIPDEERRWTGLAAAHIGIPVDFYASDDDLLFDPAHPSRAPWPEPVDRSMAKMEDASFGAAAAFSRVVLTGYGGDPLQYPEPTYVPRLLRQCSFARLAANLAATVRDQRRLPPLYLRSGARRWWRARRGASAEVPPLPAWLNPELARRLDLADRWRCWHQAVPEQEGVHPNRPMAAGQLAHALWPSIFDSYDAGVTGLPLEGRHPFFDTRLVAFMLRVPPLPWCVDKALLRRAMRGRLCEPVRLRPKTPLAGDPKHPLAPALRPVRLHADQIRAFAVVAPDGSFTSSGAAPDDLAAVVPLVSLDLWFREALTTLPIRNGATHHDRTYTSVAGGQRFQPSRARQAGVSVA